MKPLANLKAEELVKNSIEVTDQILLSACPFCKTNFEDVIEKTGKKIRYLDINQFVLDRIKKEGNEWVG